MTQHKVSYLQKVKFQLVTNQLFGKKWKECLNVRAHNLICSHLLAFNFVMAEAQPSVKFQLIAQTPSFIIFPLKEKNS